MITSKLFTLNVQDLLKGLLLTIGGAVFAIIAPNLQEILTSSGKAGFILDWTAIWHTAIATGIVYLAHRFITPAQKVTPIQ